MSKRFIAIFAATLALLFAGGGLSQQSMAQDASTPTMDNGSMGAPADHPGHIHLGTCAELGEVVFPLNNLTSGDGAATPEGDVVATPDAAAMTSSDEDAGATSSTVVEASLDDIIAGGHAVNIHESVENIQNYIACGDIAGTPTDGVLELELGELNESGDTGTATLTDNGDGTTTVDATVTHSEEGSPEASPAS